MTDHRPQWGCPYCPRIFPSRDDVKEHLGQQHVLDLLSHVQQALSPSCQQLRETTEGSTVSEGNDIDLDSTRRSHAEETLRCPHSECKAVFGRRDHLHRHYKMHVACDVECECGNSFNYVDRFEKHIPNCLITQGYKGGNADYEKKYTQVLGIVKILTKTASQALNEQLTSQFEKPTKLSSSNDTPNTTIQSLKRKRAYVGNEKTLETLYRTGETRHQEDSILKDRKGAVHLGSLDSLDSITSYATQTFNNSTSHLYPNESTNDPPPAKNTVDGSSLTHESNNFGLARQTETAGGDWNDWYAGDSTTNQDQWNFGSMNDSAHHNSNLFNTTNGVGEDWDSWYALDNFNNIQAPEVWIDTQGKSN